QGRPAPPRTRTRFRTRSGRSDHIEKINGPLLFGDKGAPGEYQRRPGARRHTGLVGIARIRNLRKVHNDWRRSVRLMAWKYADSSSATGLDPSPEEPSDFRWSDPAR